MDLPAPPPFYNTTFSAFVPELYEEEYQEYAEKNQDGEEHSQFQGMDVTQYLEALRKSQAQLSAIKKYPKGYIPGSFPTIGPHRSFVVVPAESDDVFISKPREKNSKKPIQKTSQARALDYMR